MFGRSRESRSREAAGRRNWPEAVTRKMRGRKRERVLLNSIHGSEQEPSQAAGGEPRDIELSCL
jgi:hypothetical protein